MKNSENSKKPLRNKPAHGKTSSPTGSKGDGSKGKADMPGEKRRRPTLKADQNREQSVRNERSSKRTERSGERNDRRGKRTERSGERGERSGKRTEHSGEQSDRSGERLERKGERTRGKGRKPGVRGVQRKGKDGATKPEETRLNKYIAHAGICSRREADKLIEAGLVSVNGKVVTELGTKVAQEDDVRYNGERLGNERKVYLLLNKPKDYVTTLDDPHAKKTVMDLVSKACRERIYPVGRLDKNTTGVLLFTNDGDLTKRLTHPSFNKKKIYHVFLDKNLLHEDMQKIADGIELKDGIAQVDAIAYASNDTKKEVGLEIHSGKNRVVRRIFEHMGYKVTKLDRVYFAGLTKKNLPRGRWRLLTEKEVKMLNMNAFE
ncbi:MAG: pseudouridine synthase [Bacteroidales bacterium]